MINKDFACSAPSRLAHIRKSQINSKTFFFDNKGQRSWAQKFTFLMEIYHAKCFSNLFSYAFQIALFAFSEKYPFFWKGLTGKAKNGRNGLWKPQKWSSCAKNIWNFLFSTQNYIVKNSVPQMLKFVAACSLKGTLLPASVFVSSKPLKNGRTRWFLHLWYQNFLPYDFLLEIKNFKCF